MKPSELRAFYLTAKFTLPPDSRFRQFGFRLLDGEQAQKTVRPCGKTIRTAEDLRALALRRLPLSIYAMRAKFLQAKNVRKVDGPLSRNGFLSGDFVLDFDGREGESKEATLREAEAARDFLSGLDGFKDLECWLVDSGRGCHVQFFDWFPITERRDLNPKDRYNIYRIRILRELDGLRKAGFGGFDDAPSEGARQIFRVVGSLNHRTGTVVSIVSRFAKRGQPRDA